MSHLLDDKNYLPVHVLPENTNHTYGISLKDMKHITFRGCLNDGVAKVTKCYTPHGYNENRDLGI